MNNKDYGCMGTTRGNTLIEKSMNALNLIFAYDDRFNPIYEKKIKPNKLQFEISDIYMNEQRKMNKEEFILNLKKINPKKNIYAMKVKEKNKSAFYIPSMLEKFNNVDILVDSLMKKAGIKNKNPIFFLIPSKIYYF
jgi:hypothetical protein